MTTRFADIRDNRDGPDRDFCQTKAAIVTADAERLACVVVDISGGGAKLVVEAHRPMTNRFKLIMQADQEVDTQYDCELRWREKEHVGVKFLP